MARGRGVIAGENFGGFRRNFWRIGLRWIGLADSPRRGVMALALLVEADLVLAEATCFGARPRRYCGREFRRILAQFLANWVALDCVVDP